MDVYSLFSSSTLPSATCFRHNDLLRWMLSTCLSSVHFSCMSFSSLPLDLLKLSRFTIRCHVQPYWHPLGEELLPAFVLNVAPMIAN